MKNRFVSCMLSTSILFSAFGSLPVRAKSSSDGLGVDFAEGDYVNYASQILLNEDFDDAPDTS